MRERFLWLFVVVALVLFQQTTVLMVHTSKTAPHMSSADEQGKDPNCLCFKEPLKHTPNEFFRSTSPMDDGNITWMGNAWIPPPGTRLYAAHEIQSYLRQFSILFLGDSTMRRAYGTLYAIFNASSPSLIGIPALDDPTVIDVNKKGYFIEEPCFRISNTSLCRHMPHTKKKFDLVRSTCLDDMVRFIDSPLFSEIKNDYDLIVASGGLWDTNPRYRGLCLGDKRGLPRFPEGPPVALDKLMELLQEVASSSTRRVVWRTSGFNNYRNKKEEEDPGNRILLELNQQAVRCIRTLAQQRWNRTGQPSNLTYIDWGKALLPRSFGEERIHGDLNVHYGLEARLLFIQMLMNHLKM